MPYGLRNNAVASLDLSGPMPALAIAWLPGLVIAGFGWGICLLAGMPVGYLPIVWFAGAALVYTVDSWADAGPDRLSAPARADRFRSTRLSKLGLAAAGAAILLPPLLAGDAALAMLLAGGVVVAVNYAVQLPGMPRRWRCRPWLKSLLPAPAITATVLLLPALRIHADLRPLLPWAAWVLVILQLNIWLCDLRDRAADARSGLPSLVLVLGSASSGLVLKLMLMLAWLTAAWLIARHPAQVWPVAAVTFALTCCTIISRRPRSRSFYDYAVDGALILPLLFFVSGF